MVATMTPDEVVCMAAIDGLGGHPRPRGQLSPDDHARLLLHRLFPTVARLLALDDDRPFPGPSSPSR